MLPTPLKMTKLEFDSLALGSQSFWRDDYALMAIPFTAP